MSDDTLLQHMAFVESKLAVIAAAFAQIEEEHKELLTKVRLAPDGPLMTSDCL
jgi:hypothetical protein